MPNHDVACLPIRLFRREDQPLRQHRCQVAAVEVAFEEMSEGVAPLVEYCPATGVPHRLRIVETHGSPRPKLLKCTTGSSGHARIAMFLAIRRAARSAPMRSFLEVPVVPDVGEMVEAYDGDARRRQPGGGEQVASRRDPPGKRCISDRSAVLDDCRPLGVGARACVDAIQQHVRRRSSASTILPRDRFVSVPFLGSRSASR